MKLDLDKYRGQYADIDHPIYGLVMVYTNIDVAKDAKYYTKINIVAQEEDVLIVKYRDCAAYHENMMPYYDQICNNDGKVYAWLVFDAITNKWNVGHMDFEYKGAHYE